MKYRQLVYGICVVFYAVGFLGLLDFLYTFQNVTFHNSYITILYPIFALILLSFYVSLFKVMKKIKNPNLQIKINHRHKKLYLIIIGIIAILLSLVVTFHMNPYHVITLLAFTAYLVSLVLGYRFIQVTDEEKRSFENRGL